MNSIRKTFLFAAAFLVAFGPALQAAVEVGRPAPAFSLTDIAGKTHQLTDYRGKIVVLEWVNSGCPIVRAHYDSNNMQETQKVAAADGVVWLQINTSQAGDQGHMNDVQAAAWLKQRGATSTAYLKDYSGKVGRLYGARSTPHMFIINPEGTLVYQGAIDSGNGRDIPTATNYVKAALASLKAGKPIEKPVSHAYGCAIHYPRNDS
jgi:alkyl hydroperoxide reductase subunit AhpC